MSAVSATVQAPAMQAFEALVATADPSEYVAEDLLTVLSVLPEETLIALAERLPSFRQQDRCLLSELVRRAFPALDPRHFGSDRRKRPAIQVANLIAFAPEALALARAHVWLSPRPVIQRGLGAYETDRCVEAGPGVGRCVKVYLHAPPDERDEAAAFILAVHLTDLAASESDEDWARMGSSKTRKAEADPRLLAVVRRHLADPQRILQATFDRKAIDPDLIESLLTSTTPALTEGLL